MMRPIGVFAGVMALVMTPLTGMAASSDMQRADVWLSNHPVFDGTFAKIAAKRRDGGSPFVTGQAIVQRALQVVAQCSRIALSRDYP